MSDLPRPTPWLVLSFSAGSLATAVGLHAAATAVQTALGEGHRPVLVHAAQEGEDGGALDGSSSEAAGSDERLRALGRMLGADVAYGEAGALLQSSEEFGEPAVDAKSSDPSLVHRLATSGAAIHLLQGSDTMAATLAARLGAVRLDVWGEAPGLCTADPRVVPSARILRHLGYADAQATAHALAAGASVLDPLALDIARRARIPVHVRCTLYPDEAGTVVSDAAPETGDAVLALAVTPDVTMVTVKATGADVLAAFERLRLSVDLVVASGREITVTFGAASATPASLPEAVLVDLGTLSEVRIAGPFATVRLVGRGLGTRLPDVAEALDGHPLHLICHTEDALALVVDPDRAEPVLRELHAALFGATDEGPIFGSTVGETMGRVASARPAWWRGRREAVLAVARKGTPRYVYDAATIRAAARSLRAVAPVDRVLYALKANPHPGVLRALREEGVGFECVSLGEVERVFDLFPDHDPERVLFTPNFAPRAEYERAFGLGVTVTVDNHYVLDAWPDVFAGRTAFVRVDPGQGRGHHAYVRTAGARSKFGVAADALAPLAERAAEIGLRVRGLHAHLGSGITDAATWAETAEALAAHLSLFPDVRVLDLGGGLGVPTRPSEPAFDVAAAAEPLRAFKEAYPNLELWLEPGRYLVAEAGVLLTRVTQLKQKAGVRFVGVDAGMNALVRPVLYGAYHEIVNLSRLGAAPAWTAEVVGPICESGDVLGHARRLPATEEGDVVLVAATGAYGHAMASAYNLRPLPEEVMVEFSDEAAA